MVASWNKVLSRVYTPYAVGLRTQPKCANESTHLTRVGALYSTRISRRVYADIYAISVAYHFREMDLFYMPRKSLRVRIGCGLLANDNPASTRKRRRIFVYTRHLRDPYGVDRHWWPRQRAPSAQNGLHIDTP